MYSQAPGNRNFRKRRQEPLVSSSDVSGNLVEDKSFYISTANNVADSAKVKQYLDRLNIQDKKKLSACLKIVLCDSEIALFTSEEQEALQNHYKVESISISGRAPHSVDRIVTLHGELSHISRCALHITFLMCSKANNFLKIEPFTLKSQNYKLNVLVESDELAAADLLKKFSQEHIDMNQYETNSGLQLATLKGDLSSIFKSLAYLSIRFDYFKYISDDNIEFLPIIRSHDGDSLKTRLDRNDKISNGNNVNVLNFVFRSSNLKG